MVVFCAYMQWSPVVDLDYVSINGHEHYVGGANPHEMGIMVMPALPPRVEAFLGDFAHPFEILPVTHSKERLVPETTMRL